MKIIYRTPAPHNMYMNGVFERPRLIRHDLSMSDFTKCDIDGGVFLQSDLTGCCFTACTFINCIFDMSDLGNVIFERCRLEKCTFTKSTLANSVFADCFIDGQMQFCAVDSMEVTGCHGILYVMYSDIGSVDFGSVEIVHREEDA